MEVSVRLIMAIVVAIVAVLVLGIMVKGQTSGLETFIQNSATLGG
ncbi:MAG: hypothetical protein ABEJ99_05845 [Candidatus Nanohaloarchaea archaeon]